MENFVALDISVTRTGCLRFSQIQLLLFQREKNEDTGTVDISLLVFPLKINVPSNYVHCESL